MTAPLRMNLGRLLERQAVRHDASPFVTEAVGGRTLTYGDFNTLVNRIAHGLAGEGVAPREYVGIMLNNSMRTVCDVWSATRCAFSIARILNCKR